MGRMVLTYGIFAHLGGGMFVFGIFCQSHEVTQSILVLKKNKGCI